MPSKVWFRIHFTVQEAEVRERQVACLASSSKSAQLESESRSGEHQPRPVPSPTHQHPWSEPLRCPCLPAIPAPTPSPCMQAAQLFLSSPLLVFKSPPRPSAPSLPNVLVRGYSPPLCRAHHRQPACDVWSGSRSSSPRRYGQGCSRLLWLKEGQFSYPLSPGDAQRVSSKKLPAASLFPAFPASLSLSTFLSLTWAIVAPFYVPSLQMSRSQMYCELSCQEVSQLCCPPSQTPVFFLLGPRSWSVVVVGFLFWF